MFSPARIQAIFHFVFALMVLCVFPSAERVGAQAPSGPNLQAGPGSQTDGLPAPAKGSKDDGDLKAQEAVLKSLKGREAAPAPGNPANIKRPVPAAAKPPCADSDKGCKAAGALSFETKNASEMKIIPGLGGKPDYNMVARAVEEAGKAVVVSPEVPVAVRLSASDVNRVTCTGGEIREVHYSREKGIAVSISGKDAFIKYKYARSGSKTLYPSNPTEFFIICAELVYNIIAVPELIPSQTVRLSSGDLERIKKNQSLFSGMSTEKKILKFVQHLYTDEIPESFTVERRSGQNVDAFRDVAVRLRRTVSAEGEGMRLKEFSVELKGSSKLERIELDEKDFLGPDFTSYTLAVAMDRTLLRRGEKARLFICELTREGAELNRAQSDTTIRLDRSYVPTAVKEMPAEQGKGARQASPADTKAKANPPNQPGAGMSKNSSNN